MRLKSAKKIAALSAVFTQLRTTTTSSISATAGIFQADKLSFNVSTLNRILAEATQGSFVYFAKYFDNFTIADGSGAQDGAVFEFFKTLTDDAGIAESAATQFTKALNDIGVFTDDDVFAMVKRLTDTSRVADAYAAGLQKPLSDNVTSAEDETFVLTKKVKEDEAVLGDQINTRGIEKPLTDETPASDLYTAQVSKPQSDNASAGDEQQLHPVKVSRDTLEISEGIDTRDVGKTFAEQPALTSNITNKDVQKPAFDTGEVSAQIDTKDVAKASTDEVSTLDGIDFFAVAKVLLDVVNLTDDVDGAASILDDQELSVFKQITKIARVSEEFTRQVNFARSLTDSSSARDALAFDLARVFADAYSVGDAARVGTQKPVSDTAGVSENSPELVFTKATSDSSMFAESLVVDFTKLLYDEPSAADQTSLHVSTPHSDTSATTDVAFRAPTKVLTELVPSTDAGSLRSQGYADFTYFAEDYVGASRTF